MKNLLKIAISTFFFLSLGICQAQMRIGPKVGFNLSTMSFSSSGVSIDPNARSGLNLGIIFESSASENLSFQTGAIYSEKGSSYSIEGDGTAIDMKIYPWFLEVPYNVVYGFGTSSAKFTLLGGIYLAYGMGGKIEALGESETINFGSDGDFKSIDFGLNLGAGLKYKNILLSAQYELGLINLSTTDEVENKIKTLTFSISYLFGGKNGK